MESYLQGRSQRTIVDVIQGGIGSRLLYLVYTNDLPDIIHSHPVEHKEPIQYCTEDGDMVNFVDDGTVDVADKDPGVINRKLAGHYSKIEKYMNVKKKTCDKL